MALSDIPGMPQVRADRVVVGAVALVVLLVAAVTVIVKPDIVHRSHRSRGELVAATPTTVKPGSTYPGPIGRGTAVAPVIQGRAVAPNQVSFGGSVTSADVQGANLTVATPFTVTSAERGSGNGATITDAVVNGQRVSIAWDAGQPLPFSGTGAIDLVDVPVHVDQGGATPQLGSRTFVLDPGTYHLGSPVAVATNNLPTPMDTVTFTADGQTRISFQRQASLHVGFPVRLIGPGSATLQGTFQATSSTGPRPAAQIQLVQGPYEIGFSSTSPGAVIGELQGQVSVCTQPGTGCTVVTKAGG
ncbi:MAG TPA: hypothetical protein VHA73_16765 [Acidimicrobiales bacterium]|jgi:hypothetical protein|nr:hypothetical protein [Acidimicrobiales bacterium]